MRKSVVIIFCNTFGLARQSTEDRSKSSVPLFSQNSEYETETACWRQTVNVFISTQDEDKDEENKNMEVASMGRIMPSKKTPCFMFNEPSKQMLAVIISECYMRPRKTFPVGKDLCNIDEMHSLLKKIALRNNNKHVDDNLYSEKNKNKNKDDGDSNNFKIEVQKVIDRCIQSMTDNVYQTYVAHFNHLDNLCFFIHSAMWQQNNEKMIHQLADSAVDVLSSLRFANEQNTELLLTQERALRQQELLLQESGQLQKVMQTGHGDLQRALSDIRSDVESEQHKIQQSFHEVFNFFNRILNFQSSLRSQFHDISTFLLHSVVVGFIFYLTGSSSVREARPILFLLWGLLVMSEIAISKSSEFIRLTFLSAWRIFKPIFLFSVQFFCSVSLFTLKKLSMAAHQMISDSAYGVCSSLWHDDLKKTSEMSDIWTSFGDPDAFRHLLIRDLRILFLLISISVFAFCWLTFKDKTVTGISRLEDKVANLQGEIKNIIFNNNSLTPKMKNTDLFIRAPVDHQQFISENRISKSRNFMTTSSRSNKYPANFKETLASDNELRRQLRKEPPEVYFDKILNGNISK